MRRKNLLKDQSVKNLSIPTMNRTTTPLPEDAELLMERGGYIAAAVALFLIGFFGFFCNLMVIILMFREKQLWTPLNIILFNLICTDFSVSVLGNPFTLTASLYQRWIFGRTMCVLYGFFMALLGIASITTLTVLAFERYMMISRPFQNRNLNKPGAVMLVIVIWLYSLCLTVPPLVGWGDYVSEAADISCSVNWESKTFNATTYIIFLFAFGLVLPVGIITFSYSNIIHTMKKNTLRTGSVTKAETKVTFMIAAMIVAFLVAWTPYAVLALIIAFGDPHLVSPGVAVVPALVAKSSICYNPLIYVGLNTQFRSAWQRFLGIQITAESSQGVQTAATSVKISQNKYGVSITASPKPSPKFLSLFTKSPNNILDPSPSKPVNTLALSASPEIQTNSDRLTPVETSEETIKHKLSSREEKLQNFKAFASFPLSFKNHGRLFRIRKDKLAEDNQMMPSMKVDICQDASGDQIEMNTRMVNTD